MDTEGWIAQLGVLYKEVSSASASQGSGSHAKQFNRILSELKEEVDDEFVQEMEELSTSNRRDPFQSSDTNQAVKLKCAQLAEALGYDIPKAELETVQDMTVISMSNEQNVEQSVSQEVSIDQVIEMVNFTTLGQTQQEELKEVVNEFEDELEGEQDPGKLRELLSKAEGYSVDVAAKLSMLALQRGVTAILNL